MDNIVKFHQSMISGIQKIQLHNMWGYCQVTEICWGREGPEKSQLGALRQVNFTWLSCSLVTPSGHCVPTELCTAAAFLGPGGGSRTVARLVGAHLISVLWGE